MTLRLTQPVLLLLLAFGTEEPPIRLVPRVLDPHFAQRHRLCAEASPTAAAPLSNDDRRTVQEFVGPALLELQVHQIRDSFTVFAKAQEHLRDLLRDRPKSLT